MGKDFLDRTQENSILDRGHNMGKDPGEGKILIFFLRNSSMAGVRQVRKRMAELETPTAAVIFITNLHFKR